MSDAVIAIIGMGQRGLIILERICAFAKNSHPQQKLTIYVIDPAIAGQGIHRSDQTRILLTNTTASSVTVYCDESVQHGGPIERGTTFHEWLRNSGYRIKDGLYKRSEEGTLVPPDAFPPRALLGEYLAWAYLDITSRCPKSISIERKLSNVTGLKTLSDERLLLQLSDRSTVVADYAYLTTGHAEFIEDELDEQWNSWAANSCDRSPSRTRYIGDPHSMADIEAIEANSNVAILGTGLTAIDVIALLTVGRGGRFTYGSDNLTYERSGNEPRITLFSRQGLPPSGKPIAQIGAEWPYKARFFTLPFIERSRCLHGRQLDWCDHLLPILKKEMAYVYQCTQQGFWEPSHSFEPRPETITAVDNLLYPVSDESINNVSAYNSFILQYLEDDFSACLEGKLFNPGKAITEMIRDIQDNIRYAVDHAGLRPASHAEFAQKWCSVSNRIAAGPPKERITEFIALIKAGVVSLFSPNPKISFNFQRGTFALTSKGGEAAADFDVLVRARVPPFHPEKTKAGLIQNIIESGFCIPFTNGTYRPGGIAIDESMHVIGKDSIPRRNMWAMGYVVEGPHYYTYVLPSPGANSKAFRDANMVVRDMFWQIATHTNKKAERILT